MGITNVEEQFTFYASYHHDFWNKVIHIICVWPILWSALVLVQYVPFELSLPALATLTAVHPINVSLLGAVFYAGTYILMEKRAGSLAALLVFFCLFTGRMFYMNSFASYGYEAWQVALPVQVFAWVFQFVGHGAFEGRAPALLDNLMQALVMAPMFVLLEVMFALGYRKDFQTKMWRNVEREIAKLKASNKSAKMAKRKAKK